MLLQCRQRNSEGQSVCMCTAVRHGVRSGSQKKARPWSRVHRSSYWMTHRPWNELNRQIESLKAQKTSAQSEGISTKAQLSVSRQQLNLSLSRHSLPINSFTGRRGMRRALTGGF